MPVEIIKVENVKNENDFTFVYKIEGQNEEFKAKWNGTEWVDTTNYGEFDNEVLETLNQRKTFYNQPENKALFLGLKDKTNKLDETQTNLQSSRFYGYLGWGVATLMTIGTVAGIAKSFDNWNLYDNEKDKVADLKDTVSDLESDLAGINSTWEHKVANWNSTFYNNGFNASLEQQKTGLESRIQQRFDSDLINDTAKKMFNDTALVNLSYAQLLDLDEQLLYGSGMLDQASGAMDQVLMTISSDYNVSLENLTQTAKENNWTLMDAIKEYARQTAVKAANEAGITNFTAGKDFVYAQSDAWNNTWKSIGFDDAFNISKEGVLDAVNHLINVTFDKEHYNAENLTKIIQTYGEKIAADALALTDYTSDYVIDEYNSGNLANVEVSLNRLGALYGQVVIDHKDNGTAYQSLMSNLTENDTKELTAAGLNMSWYFNRDYDMRFVDTFDKDCAVVQWSNGDDMKAAKVSQTLFNKIKDWYGTYQKGGE